MFLELKIYFRLWSSSSIVNGNASSKKCSDKKLTALPANTRCWPNVGWLLTHLLRRWPNIHPALCVCYHCLLICIVLSVCTRVTTGINTCLSLSTNHRLLLKCVGLHGNYFLKYLSLGPTKILPVVPFYINFKPYLDATRCHQKAVNGVLKCKFSWGEGGGHAPKSASTARRWRAPRLRHVIYMDYGIFRFILKPPLWKILDPPLISYWD